MQKLEKARTDNQILITSFVGIVFVSAVGTFFVTLYAFYVHWLVGLAYSLLFPVIGTVIYFLSQKIKEKQKQIVAQQADLAGSTTETYIGLKLFVEAHGAVEI